MALHAGHKRQQFRRRFAVGAAEHIAPAVPLLHAHVPVHPRPRAFRVGLGQEGGGKAVAQGHVARQALEAEHGVGLRQRRGGREVDLVLGRCRLVREAGDGNVLRAAARKQGGEEGVEGRRALQRKDVDEAFPYARMVRAGRRRQVRALARAGDGDQEEFQLRRHLRRQAARLQPLQHALEDAARRQRGRLHLHTLGRDKTAADVAQDRGALGDQRVGREGRPVRLEGHVRIGSGDQVLVHGARLAAHHSGAEDDGRQPGTTLRGEFGRGLDLAPRHRRQVRQRAFDRADVA